jgi:radical SAM protein with 4Fe4S-binding SPASM domain
VGLEHLDELFAYAKHRGASEIELLRLKPAGRGASRDTYHSLRCTDAQHRSLVPTILALSRRHRLPTRLDCSLVPFVAHQQLETELLRFLSIYGCAGGDLLTAARADGKLSACSFASPTSERVTNLRRYFADPSSFTPFRDYQAAEEPCHSCRYLTLCRGGCRVVAVHKTGSLRAPDPECPRVIDWQAQQANRADAPLPTVSHRLKVIR